VGEVELALRCVIKELLSVVVACLAAEWGFVCDKVDPEGALVGCGRSRGEIELT